MTRDWSDFTETAYGEILDLAKARYRFADFCSPGDGRHVLWRHDLDHSVHRGLRLAEIEQAKGVQSTCFFLLDQLFYNLGEPTVRQCGQKILSLGHKAGLHFNPALEPTCNGSLAALEREMVRQRDRLADLLGHPIVAVSFHNPTLHDLMKFDQPILAGMVNTYGGSIKLDYHYVSDSNGYWRYDILPAVLREGNHRQLHVLTHPEWWTPTPMAPRARIERCVQGRATAVMAEYDGGMRRGGRENISE